MMTFTSVGIVVDACRSFRTDDDVEDDDAGLEKWRDVHS